MVQEQNENIKIKNNLTGEVVEGVKRREKLGQWEKDGKLYLQREGWAEDPPPRRYVWG